MKKQISDFIELPGKSGEIMIRVSTICGITQSDGNVLIWTSGDTIPFKTKAGYEEIKQLILTCPK